MISTPISSIDPDTETSLKGEPARLLKLSDGRPAEFLNIEGKSTIVLIRKHTSNRILGILESQVAWDPSAFALENPIEMTPENTRALINACLLGAATTVSKQHMTLVNAECEKEETYEH